MQFHTELKVISMKLKKPSKIQVLFTFREMFIQTVIPFI